MNLQRLSHDGHSLTYASQPGRAPGVVFLGGYASDMTGTKANFLAERCAATGRAFLRFDYRGHGQSSGDFRAACISDWLGDALAVFDRCSEGKQILVGSSMGGWIALLLALARPQRVAGLVGIAAAPDFTENLLEARLTESERDRLMHNGLLEKQEDPALPPLVYTRKLIEDGRRHLLLRGGGAIALHCPVRLLHGQQDDAVPWELSLTLAARLAAPDVRVTLIKDGDHRLSREQDCALLWSAVQDFSRDDTAECESR